jgi:glycosyltransferase involved in cell wall biosynthesis
MHKKLIVHIADINLSKESGMGRIAWHWKNEFENHGYDFVHIGSRQVGSVSHPGLFPYAARKAYQDLGRKASVFLVHEPSSGAFCDFDVPTVLFSHGLEQRKWELRLQGRDGTTEHLKLSTRFLFPIWRLRQCKLGLNQSQLILLSNHDDSIFAQEKYKKSIEQIYVFKNGAYSSSLNYKVQPESSMTVLFLGSWLERKRIGTLVEAAQILQKKSLFPKWILAGTGADKEQVLTDWPSELRSQVEVIPHFSQSTESSLLASCHIFNLPSFFEGQPLALLQAMEAGRCCITTDCCGQRDLIQHGYNGLLHEPGNSQQLASLIEQCVRDEKLRMTLGKNAKLSVKNRSWEAVSSEVVDCVENVLHSHQRETY